MRTYINSTSGLIATASLGTTLMHEHILQANWSMRQSFKEWFDYEGFIEYAIDDVKRTVDIGVKTMVEQTPVCLGRDIHAIKEVADKSLMQMIVSTGFFYTENQWLFGRGVDSILKYLMIDIEDGIQGTNIKPGLIKCATDKAGVTEINKNLLEAHAIASKISGLPIGTHSYYKNRSGLAQMDIFEQQGLNPKKIIIGHCGDTNEIDYLEELLKRGCYIGMDRFGDNEKNSLENRVNTLITLCERGWMNQIVISHDYVSFVDLGDLEWCNVCNADPDDVEYNHRYIHRHVLPLLRKRGFSSQNIGQLLVDNPRAFFEEE